MNRVARVAILFFLLLLPVLVRADCTCESETEDRNKTEAFKYKLAAIASILIASAIGVSLPILGKIVPALRPENDVFFVIKAFAAGVILATGFIHVLPDAFDNLTSPCLAGSPVANFPFTGLVAMMSAIGTMMVDAFATSYYSRSHFVKSRPVNGDVEGHGEHEGHVHVHTHATHGHSHGSAFGLQEDDSVSSELLRNRIISQLIGLEISLPFAFSRWDWRQASPFKKAGISLLLCL